MTFDRICGECGAPISGEHETCPKCPPQPARKKQAEAIPALLVLGVLCTSLLMLGTSVVNVVNAPKIAATTTTPTPEVNQKAAPVEVTDRRAAAYSAAVAYIQQQYPGRKQFAELDETTISQSGDVYVVTIPAEDLQGPSPARHFYRVELNYVDGSWELKQIKR